MRALALLRIPVGLIAVWHLTSVLDEVRAAGGRPTFADPYASWFPAAPPTVESALLVVGIVAAVALAAGLATRAAAVVTLAVIVHHLASSATNVHNNRAFLAIVLAGLAVGPCGRELSVDAWWQARRGRRALATEAPAWPLWLLRFEAASLYGASGLSKLVDPDWFGGTVTWLRVTRQRADLLASPLPSWAVDVLSDRGFHTVAAKVVIGAELFVALGLLARRTRLAAVWVAIAFHVVIQVSASVEVFSYLAIAALVIWATPRACDRAVVLDLSSDRQRRLAEWVGGLDWLARFRVVAAPPGTPAHVVDRDGIVLTGGPAAVLVLSRLPLTAWPALPLRLLVRPPRPAPGPAAPPWPVTPGPLPPGAVPPGPVPPGSVPPGPVPPGAAAPGSEETA
jgi:uncharacterized membrane protein YphA (DoxX/SURF4 family)